MTIQNDDQNQRTLRAIILCVLVAVIYTQVFLAPKRKQQLMQQAPSATNSTTTSAPAASPARSPVAVQPSGPAQVVASQPQLVQHPSRADLESQPTSFVESDAAKIAISHLGARIISYKLKQYKTNIGTEADLDMVDNPEGAVLPLGVYVGDQSDERVNYTLVSINDAPPTSPVANVQAAGATPVALEFKGNMPDGTGITKKIKMTADSYLFSVDVKLDRPSADGKSVWLEWSHYYPQDQENPRLKISHITYLDGNEKIQHAQLKDLQQGLRDFGTTRWSSLGDIYFMATVIPPAVTGRNTLLGREGDVYLTRAAAEPLGGTFDLYVGPKDYRTLKYIGGHSLERSIDLGWFSFIALPLLWFLHWLYVALSNWGLAIIALTLIVKALLLPLSKASFESMKKMQELQPEIKALKERIKDPNQLNQETLALYTRKGVNPMGGCLPMFIQIPVFLGLYQALLNSIELRHAPFALWINDLSAPEKLNILGIGVPVMVLLMAASMIVQQWTTPNPSTDPAQQTMMKVMPFIFAGMFIIFPMPAGLVLYWLVSNLISIIQQMYMRNAEKGSVYSATLMASLVIFGVGYILTLI